MKKPERGKISVQAAINQNKCTMSLEKPKLESLTFLNLIQALNHLEAIGYIGIYKRLCKKFADAYQFHNDSYFSINIPDDNELKEYDNQFSKDLRVFRDVFNLKAGDFQIVEVSW